MRLRNDPRLSDDAKALGELLLAYTDPETRVLDKDRLAEDFPVLAELLDEL